MLFLCLFEVLRLNFTTITIACLSFCCTSKSVFLIFQHWSNISTSIGHSVEWPRKISRHAATHLSGPLFVIVGGLGPYPTPVNEMWLCDTTTKLWKKVLFLVTVLCMHAQTHKLPIINCDMILFG